MALCWWSTRKQPAGTTGRDRDEQTNSVIQLAFVQQMQVCFLFPTNEGESPLFRESFKLINRRNEFLIQVKFDLVPANGTFAGGAEENSLQEQSAVKGNRVEHLLRYFG
ncbi:hypothetical protein CEXT_463961 [Caerostris extrusa]|uniref:Uncharacterized protein n=1 Tax=Caerostris extrusa TaxID=172846 RepID=A0AAV4M567_CAEEX|nr:hypothetical protein CEXT_463961 [Caerostris extrusa]